MNTLDSTKPQREVIRYYFFTRISGCSGLLWDERSIQKGLLQSCYRVLVALTVFGGNKDNRIFTNSSSTINSIYRLKCQYCINHPTRRSFVLSPRYNWNDGHIQTSTTFLWMNYAWDVFVTDGYYTCWQKKIHIITLRNEFLKQHGITTMSLSPLTQKSCILWFLTISATYRSSLRYQMQLKLCGLVKRWKVRQAITRINIFRSVLQIGEAEAPVHSIRGSVFT